MSAFTLLNNVKVSLAATITSAITTLTFNNPAAPFNPVSVNSGEVGCITLVDDPTNPTKIEIVTFTGSSSAAGVVTCTGCTRGAEGTTAQAWSNGTLAFEAATAAVLKSLSTVPAFMAPAYFGTGADGNVTVNSSTTLTRDMNYNNLTMTTGGTINTSGFRIYVAGTLDLSAAVANAIFASAGSSGGAGSSSLPGTGGSGGSGITVPPGAKGGAGVAAGNVGNPDKSQLDDDNLTGVFIGGIGRGGEDSTQVGGGSGGAKVVINSPYAPMVFTSETFSGAGGGGGGGGLGGTSNSGGGGGGGSSLWISANAIVKGSGTPAGTLLGGTGGNGGAHAGSSSGDGGAGGGGSVYIFCGSLSGPVIPNCVKSTGGTNPQGHTAFGGDILVCQLIGTASFTLTPSASTLTTASL